MAKVVTDERLRRFVEAYMGEAAGNGAQAAKIAGLRGTAKQRSNAASKWLRRDDVKAMMNVRVAADPLVLTREQRQAMWTTLANGGDVKQVVGGVVITAPISVRDRLKASELLARSQGDFVERHEHKITGQVEVFTIQVPTRDVLPEPEG